MEASNGQPEAPDDGQGGLVTRERHVFKVPAPKTSLLGKQGCIAPFVGTCRCMQARVVAARLLAVALATGRSRLIEGTAYLVLPFSQPQLTVRYISACHQFAALFQQMLAPTGSVQEPLNAAILLLFRCTLTVFLFSDSVSLSCLNLLS